MVKIIKGKVGIKCGIMKDEDYFKIFSGLIENYRCDI